MDIVKTVRELIENSITLNGYILDEVLFEKEGNMNFLRIIIDKEPIVEIEDCVKISKIISPILDEKNPISINYILDVCSKEKGR
ncbi:MAG: hypothetical protein RR404_02010 [Bacilli bacterium]